MLEDQLKSAESQIEDLKMSVDKSEEDQKKWLEQRKTLEGDLESAESRLEETATLLNKERSLRCVCVCVCVCERERERERKR